MRLSRKTIDDRFVCRYPATQMQEAAVSVRIQSLPSTAVLEVQSCLGPSYYSLPWQRQ